MRLGLAIRRILQRYRTIVSGALAYLSLSLLFVLSSRVSGVAFASFCSPHIVTLCHHKVPVRLPVLVSSLWRNICPSPLPNDQTRE
jgi:hypothetical protein